MIATAMQCPKCNGPMWDETQSKYYKPGGPIAKCKDKACGGKIFATANGGAAPTQVTPPARQPVTLGAPLPGEKDAAFEELFLTYDVCFAHALSVAKRSKEKHDLGFTAEGVASVAATLFIAATKRGA